MTAADPDRARADALFAEALELRTSERAAFLDRSCAAEPLLRAEVEALLRLASAPAGALDSRGLLDGPLWNAFTTDLASSAEPSPSASIGSWRLMRELGRGGMGTVYLAERADGEFEQTAALKLLRPGADSDELLRRFEQERQILARLQHPNVARLLDGGRAPDGRPFFAMEYVEGGRPLDQYCDEKRLRVDERLDLIVKVGRAVQHAHRNLVVHRDLKPSNILVTPDGEVKLLDFGVAKLLADETLEGAALTRTAARILTPEYASPEQVLGRPVTTASDVYQLGLLLYELLTGVRAQRVSSLSPISLQQAICETQPTRPSAAVTTEAQAHDLAASRGTTPAALARKLRGDLDNVVLMALRKEPERRYASADHFVEDLERYQKGLPLRARTDTLGYRLRRFVGRHPFGVGVAAAFALLLLGYAGTLTRQARELARERDRAQLEARKAERVRDFVLGLFEAADPYRTKGVQVTAGELLDTGGRKVQEELGDEPEVRAELLGVLGTVLSGRASYERAETLLAEAVALERRSHAGDHPHVARAAHGHALVLTERGQFEKAEALARESLAMRRRLFGTPHADVAESLGGIAMAVASQGRYVEAEALYREALAVRTDVSGPDHPEIAELWNNLGVQLAKQNKHEEAEAAHRVSLEGHRRHRGPDHPATSQSLNNLAVVLRHRGKLGEAEALYREALAVRRRVFGTDHPQVANVLNNLGDLLRRLRRFDEAAASQREALAIRRKVLGPKHPNVAMSLHNLASVVRDAGDTREAARLYEEALALSRSTLPAGHVQIGASALNLGRLRAAASRHQEAERLLEEALAIRVAAGGDDSVAAAEARLALGILRALEGRRDDGRTQLEAGLRRLRQGSEGDAALIAEAEAALVSLGQDVR